MVQELNRLIVALDFADQRAALELAQQLDPKRCRLKVGKEMFTRCGPSFVSKLQVLGFEIFLDLKFHDIPNTVAKACLSAADLGVWMINVHASGGRAMMEQAAQALDNFGADKPLLTAVTVLTSMNQQQLNELGIERSIAEQVQSLASLAQDSGVDGVVCSAQEASMLRTSLPADKEFLLVTPGIRPAGAATDDQHRIMTPTKALAEGVDYLVIGRPITKAEHPLKSMCDIADSIDSYLQSS